MEPTSATNTAIKADQPITTEKPFQLVMPCDNIAEAASEGEDKQTDRVNFDLEVPMGVAENIKIEINMLDKVMTPKVVEIDSVKQTPETPIGTVPCGDFHGCETLTSAKNTTDEDAHMNSATLVKRQPDPKHSEASVMIMGEVCITEYARDEIRRRLESLERDAKRMKKSVEATNKSIGQYGEIKGGNVEFMARRKIEKEFGRSYTTDPVEIKNITDLCEMYLLPKHLGVRKKWEELQKQTRSICKYLYKSIDSFIWHYMGDLEKSYGVRCEVLEVFQQDDKLFLTSRGNQISKEKIDEILAEWKRAFGKISESNIKKTAFSVVDLLCEINSTDFSQSSDVDKFHEYLCSDRGLGVAILVHASRVLEDGTVPKEFTFYLLKELEIDCAGKMERIGAFVNVDIAEVKSSRTDLSKAREQLTLRLNAIALAVTIIDPGVIVVNKIGRCYYSGREDKDVQNFYDKDNKIAFTHTNV